MARQVVVLLTCDICGSDSDVKASEFAVGRSVYEVDLCGAHQDEFTAALAPFVGAARKARTSAATPSVSAVTSNRAVTRRDPAQTEAIRSWAKANGHAISSRGRIPGTIEAAYNSRS